MFGYLLKQDGHSTAVGDEGGLAPNLASDEAAIEYLHRAIQAAGRNENEVKIALDAAASEWTVGDRYRLPKADTVLSASVAECAPLIKVDAPCRTDRVAKYNRLLRIEASLGKAEYGGIY